MLQKFAGSPVEDEPWQAFAVTFFRKRGARGVHDVIYEESSNTPDFNWDEWGGAIVIIRVDANPFTFLNGSEHVVEMAYRFNLYYRIDDLQIRNVVDLRYPDTQEAFVATFFPDVRCAHPTLGRLGNSSLFCRR